MNNLFLKKVIMRLFLLITPSIVLVLASMFFSGCGETKNDGTWVIGFSQVTVKEPWRVVFNEKLKSYAEALGDSVELIILDADDKTENQVEHIKTFIVKQVDAIMISPKEAAGSSKAIQEAVEMDIPVIVLDRETTFKEYTAFIGGNNREIGREAGRYVVEVLGGKGNAEGIVYEICGGLASTPAQERRDGFHEIVEKEQGIEILGEQDGDWKLDKAKSIAQDALQIHKNIDVIYAHNDPMAYGAYQAAREFDMEDEIIFVGIDALPHEGAVWVREGILDATFVYPTPGVAGLEYALEILEGEREPNPGERIMLPTIRITKENVDEYLSE